MSTIERALPLEPAEPGSVRRWATLALRAGSLLAFLAVLVFFSATAPFFLSFFNFTNVIAQSAILAILAFGMTVVIIGGGGNVVTGGIDLSVAANLGLCAAVYAALTRPAMATPPPSPPPSSPACPWGPPMRLRSCWSASCRSWRRWPS